ncbi:MAG: hypothetical protein PHE61_06065 [Candidatus Omnitrophica bacterium]|nr:hypothetical protein [Candidatus Omnitrophota bacterium]
MSSDNMFERVKDTEMSFTADNPAQAVYWDDVQRLEQKVRPTEEAEEYLGGAFATPLDEKKRQRRKESGGGEAQVDSRVKADEKSYQEEVEKEEKAREEEELKRKEKVEGEKEREEILEEIDKRIQEKRKKTYGVTETEAFTPQDKERLLDILTSSGIDPYEAREIMLEIYNEQSLYATLSLYDFRPNQIKNIMTTLRPAKKESENQ